LTPGIRWRFSIIDWLAGLSIALCHPGRTIAYPASRGRNRAPVRWFDSLEKKKGIMPSLDFRLVALVKLPKSKIYFASNHGIMPNPRSIFACAGYCAP